MARNEEKAQSMLYRFREAQAAELGLGVRGDKRPRMASACNSLRDCERWRGEILREISRKVSKIQDAGLTDYEIRDLNDEINKLMREKRHWENQIVALGGANYRRNAAMLDDDGREVPGTKGYKYFGRAKDLPGVRELFQSKKKEEDEENATLAHYKKFIGQGPQYFGDLDDEEMRKAELEEEKDDWNEACNTLKGTLGLPQDASSPAFPLASGLTQAVVDKLKPPDEAVTTSTSKSKAKSKGKSKKEKRKAETADADGDEDMADAEEAVKRAKISDSNGASESQPQAQAAHLAASFIPFLSPSDLMPPQMPTREEMEGILLELKKKALVDEYFGDET